MDLAYDGTEFFGWAKQPGLRTVQGDIEEALARILRTPYVVSVAGRTDAGVHARAQVIHVDIDRDRWEALPGRSELSPEQSLRRKLDALTGSDVVVSAATEVSSMFDARFSAIWRRYSYTLAPEGTPRDPLTRRQMWWVARTLNLEAMNRAAASLKGEHDFLAYCKPRAGATTIRTLQHFHLTQDASGLIRADVRADAFCHSMVRSLMGAMVMVGAGRADSGWPAQILAARVRDSRLQIAPPHGLVLEEVGYPPADQWGRRAVESRRRRDESDRATAAGLASECCE